MIAKKEKKIEDLGKKIFFVAVFLLGAMVAFTFQRLTIPLLISYITYLVVNPLVPTLMKFGFTKTWAVVAVFSGVIFFTVAPMVRYAPNLRVESERVEYYLPKIENYVRTKYYKSVNYIKEKTGIEIGDKVLVDSLIYAKDFSKKVIIAIPKVLANLLEWIFVVPLFLFFLLRDGRNFRKLLVSLAPNSYYERFYMLIHQFNKKLGDYIFAKFIEASIVGCIITVGLLFMDVRFAFLLGLVAAVTNIIPYVGPILGAVPGILLALAEYGSGGSFVAIVVLYSVANAIDLAIVFPLLVSKIVDLHPVTVVVSVIVGSQYLGLMGMIISIPSAAACKLILTEIHRSLYGVNNR